MSETRAFVQAPIHIDARPSFEKNRAAWSLVAGACVALCTGAIVGRCTAHPADKHFGQRQLERQPITPISGQDILADIAAAHGQPNAWSAVFVAEQHGDAATPTPKIAASANAAAHDPEAPDASCVRARRAPSRRASSAPAMQPTTRDAYASLFGDAEQFRAGNALQPRHTVAQQRGGAIDGDEGRLMPARLETEVASAPSGGPVVAVLQRPSRLAGQLLPRGTQIHGTCRGTGNSDTRVFIHFDFVRLAGGKSHPITGIAVDLEGRHGVPGRKVITSRSVGSVGLTAAARAARALGRNLAGSVGGAIGAGIDGAADAGGQKAQRLDRDEYVVIAARGTPLQIYLGDGRKP